MGTLLRGVFTARRYASAVYAVMRCLSVHPSVCLSVRHVQQLYKPASSGLSAIAELLVSYTMCIQRPFRAMGFCLNIIMTFSEENPE